MTFFVTGAVILGACKFVAFVLDGHHSLVVVAGSYVVAITAIMLAGFACMAIENRRQQP